MLWIERTPPEFTFNIKAYSLLTNHPTKRDSLYKDLQDSARRRQEELYREQLPDEAVDEVWQRFRDALMPLHSAGKLGAVLFQFPQWFVISKKSKAYIEEVVERLPDFRVAVEFRHKSWMEERNVEETLVVPRGARPAVRLRRHAAGVRLVPPPDRRRDREGPRHDPVPRARPRRVGAKGIPASERFRYDYKRDELNEWVPKVEALAEEARETHVLMNNCYQDFAVRSARELGDLLDLLERYPGRVTQRGPAARDRQGASVGRANTGPPPTIRRRTPHGSSDGDVDTAAPGSIPRSVRHLPNARRDERRTSRWGRSQPGKRQERSRTMNARRIAGGRRASAVRRRAARNAPP